VHRALDTPSWALEGETLLAEWLSDVTDGHRWNVAQRQRDVPHHEIVAAAANAFGRD
jgi:hypothetical protein